MIVGDGIDRIRQEHNFISLFGDQTAHQHIVSRTILDGLVASEAREVSAGGGNRGPEREFHAVQILGDQNAGIKIRRHADFLDVVHNPRLQDGNVEAGYGADLLVCQRRDDRPQIIRIDADVAIVDHHHFVLRLRHQARQLGYFVVDGVASRSVKHANLAVRKITAQLVQDGNHGLGGVVYTEDDFVVGIVLAAEAGKILVGVRDPGRGSVSGC